MHHKKHESTPRSTSGMHTILYRSFWRQMEYCILNTLQFSWVVGNAWRITNAPAAFQRFMINIIVIIYLDDILIYSNNIPSTKPTFGKHSTDSVLMDFLPMQTNASSMSLLANTLDICCHPKASPWPSTSTDHPRLARTMKSQGYSIFPWLLQLLLSLHSWIFWNHSSAYVSYHKGTPWHFSNEGHSALRHSKNFHNSSIPYPLDPGHSNYSRDWCLQLCACHCPFNHDSWWQVAPICIPLLDLFPSWTQLWCPWQRATHNFWSLKWWWHYLKGSGLPIDVVTDHQNLQYFSKQRSSCIDEHNGPNIFPVLTS